MKRYFLVLGALLAAGPVGAARPWGEARQSSAAGHCLANESKVIDSEARCVDSGGISIGAGDEDGAKVACMENKDVQNRCGPDGRLARLHAYTAWFNKLKKFEDACAAEGGTFSYKDPGFIEPEDESFCSQPIPEV